MQLTCPVCFARYAIEAALTDDDARRAVAAAFKMPAPLGDLILRYIGLFRAPKRALSWDRAARLIDELLAPIQSGRVERHGRTWAAPIEIWKAAITEMVERRDKLQLPLKGHGYLFEIVAAQANKAEARDERKVEEQKRQRQHKEAKGPVTVAELAKVPSAPTRDPIKTAEALDKLKDAAR